MVTYVNSILPADKYQTDCFTIDKVSAKKYVCGDNECTSGMHFRALTLEFWMNFLMLWDAVFVGCGYGQYHYRKTGKRKGISGNLYRHEGNV